MLPQAGEGRLVLNQKIPYRSDKDGPTYLYEVTVHGRKLVKDMEVTLYAGLNRPAGRYRFMYADAEWLIFYGPVRRRNQRYRAVTHEVVRTVHMKT